MVLVSRDEAYPRRQAVIVAAITTRIRDIATEVVVGAKEGLPREGVVNCDDLRTIVKRLLLRRAGSLDRNKLERLDEALRFALGLE